MKTRHYISLALLLYISLANLSANNTYSEAIDLNYNSSNLPTPPPPSNDAPCDAEIFTVSSSCSFVEKSISEASPSGIAAPSCGGYTNNKDIWFKAVVGVSGRLAIKTNNLTASVQMAVYKGSCNNLEEIACSSSDSIYVEGLTENANIWVRIWEENNNDGNFELCIFTPSPANDNPCSASIINPSNDCIWNEDNFHNATASGLAAPSCGSYNNHHDLWYKTTIGASGALEVKLNSGALNLKMALYEGSCDALTEIACDDFHLLYINGLTPGSEVWLRIWEGSNTEDNFQLCMFEPTINLPNNYKPCQAVILDISNDCHPILGTTANALPYPVADPSCASGNFDTTDVWFKAKVPASGYLTILLEEQGMTCSGIAVYSGNCHNLTERICTESTTEMPSPTNITPALSLANDFIFIRVWKVDGYNDGSFKICAYEEPPLEVITNLFSPEQLVDKLVNGCLEADNVQYDGHNNAIGYFMNGMSGVGMRSGLVMASGEVTRLLGASEGETMTSSTSNQNIINDLGTIINNPTINDVAVLEFDFTPSAAHTEFNFVFSSEEYHEFVGSFNDVFAFFISGPGIAGPYFNNAENIAVIPGTTIPITINSINENTNSNYYNGTEAGVMPFYQSEGGRTIPMRAIMDGLTPCETYHIIFAIADETDHSYNTYVFFEENSFSSGGEVSMNNISSVGQVNEIYEGCSNQYIFTRLDSSESAMLDTAWVYLDITGTAISGTDYTAIDDTLMLLPGVKSDTITYTAFLDELDEVDEYILFTLANGCPCDLTQTSDTIWIKNNYAIDGSITDDMLICKDSIISIQTQVNPNLDTVLLQYEWNTGDTTTSINGITPIETTTYKVTITNRCMDDAKLETTVFVIPYVDSNFKFAKDTACVGEPISIDFIGSCTDSADFSWDFPDGLPISSTISSPNVVQWFTTGYKTVSVDIDDNGCPATRTDSIYIKRFDDMHLSSQSTDLNCAGICDGTASVTPENTGIYNYLWDDGQTTQTATNLCPRNYKVTVTDLYGCMDTSHAYVASPTPINTFTESDSVKCFGSNEGRAIVFANGGIPPYQYMWSNDASASENNFLYAGLYTVTVSDANGCEKIEMVEIFQPEEIALAVYANTSDPEDVWACLGDTVILTAAVTGAYTPYSFYWNNGKTSDTIMVVPNISANYSVKVKDSHDCWSSVKERYVNVYPPLSIQNSVSFNDHTICAGENIELSVIPHGGNGNYTIELISNAGTETVGGQILISPTESQQYTIKLSDDCNSPAVTQNVIVNVRPLPSVSFSADITDGCVPIDIHLQETSEDTVCSYQWIVSNGTTQFTAFEKEANFSFNQSGIYDVKLFKTNTFGCKGSNLKDNYINIHPIPIAKFTSDKPNFNTSILNTSFTFHNSSQHSNLFYWSFNDTDSSRLENPVYNFPPVAGDYWVTLRAENGYGCFDTISQLVRITEEVALYIPTAFTPNGDGTNDAFKVFGKGIQADKFSLKIYDRWSKLVKEIKDPEKEWNGFDQQGHKLPIGTYVWFLEYTDINNKVVKRTGQLNLIR